MLCQPAVLVYLIFSWPLISVSSTLSFGLLPKSSSLIAQLSTVPIYIPQILWWICKQIRQGMQFPSIVCSYLISLFSHTFFLLSFYHSNKFSLFPFLDHILSPPSCSSAWNILPLISTYWCFPFLQGSAQISLQIHLLDNIQPSTRAHWMLFVLVSVRPWTTSSCSFFQFSIFSGANSSAECRAVRVKWVNAWKVLRIMLNIWYLLRFLPGCLWPLQPLELSTFSFHST